MNLAPGDLLELRWLSLPGRPKSLYQVVAVLDGCFWYYKMGTTKLSCSTLDTITYGVSSCEFSASIVRL